MSDRHSGSAGGGSGRSGRTGGSRPAWVLPPRVQHQGQLVGMAERKREQWPSSQSPRRATDSAAWVTGSSPPTGMTRSPGRSDMARRSMFVRSSWLVSIWWSRPANASRRTPSTRWPRSALVLAGFLETTIRSKSRPPTTTGLRASPCPGSGRRVGSPDSAVMAGQAGQPWGTGRAIDEGDVADVGKDNEAGAEPPKPAWSPVQGGPGR